MKMVTTWFFFSIISLACKRPADTNIIDKKIDLSAYTDTIPRSVSDYSEQISIKGNSNPVISEVTAHELVDFAKTLIGIPYKYASSDPGKGFDCSGFITYVFNHFHIEVPRSSVDFTNVGKEVDVQNAQEGDLILFTGTVDSIRMVGHMGIVTENADILKFIHSTSGKANGVTVSVLNDHYKKRFVKVIRVFSD